MPQDSPEGEGLNRVTDETTAPAAQEDVDKSTAVLSGDSGIQTSIAIRGPRDSDTQKTPINGTPITLVSHAASTLAPFSHFDMSPMNWWLSRVADFPNRSRKPITIQFHSFLLYQISFAEYSQVIDILPFNLSCAAIITSQ